MGYFMQIWWFCCLLYTSTKAYGMERSRVRRCIQPLCLGAVLVLYSHTDVGPVPCNMMYRSVSSCKVAVALLERLTGSGRTKKECVASLRAAEYCTKIKKSGRPKQSLVTNSSLRLAEKALR